MSSSESDSKSESSSQKSTRANHTPSPIVQSHTNTQRTLDQPPYHSSVFPVPPLLPRHVTTNTTCGSGMTDEETDDDDCKEIHSPTERISSRSGQHVDTARRDPAEGERSMAATPTPPQKLDVKNQATALRLSSAIPKLEFRIVETRRQLAGACGRLSRVPSFRTKIARLGLRTSLSTRSPSTSPLATAATVTALPSSTLRSLGKGHLTKTTTTTPTLALGDTEQASATEPTAVADIISHPNVDVGVAVKNKVDAFGDTKEDSENGNGCQIENETGSITKADDETSVESWSEFEYTTQTIIDQAQSVVSNHINSLKRYNEVKDVAMGLLGMIAEREGKTVRSVMEERGVDFDT